MTLALAGTSLAETGFAALNASRADVALGEIAWAVLRGALYSTAFMLAMWAMGMVQSPWIVLSVPICVLIGFSFAAIGMSLTTFMRSWEDFEYVPAITLPLFLFSTTFYPISQYGEWSWVVGLSPLYHGVELIRAANLGQWDPSIIGHVAVLVGLSVLGLLATAGCVAFVVARGGCTCTAVRVDGVGVVSMLGGVRRRHRHSHRHLQRCRDGFWDVLVVLQSDGRGPSHGTAVSLRMHSYSHGFVCVCLLST